jgi:hypothetical protein
MLSGGLFLRSSKKCGASIDLAAGRRSLGGIMVALSMPLFGHTASRLAGAEDHMPGTLPSRRPHLPRCCHGVD